MIDSVADRREWLRSCGRWGLAGLLSLLSAVLVRRRLRSPCDAAQSACSQCHELSSCGLPLARTYREASRRG